MVVALAVVAVIVTSAMVVLSMAALVRMTLRTSIEDIRTATDRIACGHFDHRIGTTRQGELGSLAASIDSMAARLAQLDRSRSAMLAAVSHELRTPLTVIRCQTYSLSRSTQVQPQIARLELIDAEVERLTSLVDDLLLASTLQAGGLVISREHVSVGALLRDAVERFADDAHRVDVEIAVSDDETAISRLIDVDVVRMHQVIGNLLANAIRHAPPKTTVHVSAVAEPQVTDRLRLAVRNSCPAACREQLESSFEPFAQGDDRVGSVGLGLAIARDLLRAHDATLAVDVRDDVVEFSFVLPLVGFAKSVAWAERSDLKHVSPGLRVAT
jgi:signal transduction histidine kinase